MTDEFDFMCVFHNLLRLVVWKDSFVKDVSNKFHIGYTHAMVNKVNQTSKLKLLEVTIENVDENFSSINTM